MLRKLSFRSTVPGISPREILFNRNSQRGLERSRASLAPTIFANSQQPFALNRCRLFEIEPFYHKNLCKAVDSSIASINRLPSLPSSPRCTSFSIHGKYSPIFHRPSPSPFLFPTLIFVPFFLLFARKRIFISTYFQLIDRSIEYRIHQFNRFISFIRIEETNSVFSDPVPIFSSSDYEDARTFALLIFSSSVSLSST